MGIIKLKNISAYYEKHRPEPIFKLRRYAILALLTEKEDQLSFVLNKRAHGVKQPGDICFPGGHQENGESLMQTSLRETEEELGIPRSKIKIYGKGDYMLTMSRGMIQPFIGYVPYHILNKSVYNPAEVAEVFTAPVKYFQETPPEIYNLTWESTKTDTFPYDRIEGGENYPFARSTVPELFYEYNGYTIWGFTAQIIQNIVDSLKEME